MGLFGRIFNRPQQAMLQLSNGQYHHPDAAGPVPSPAGRGYRDVGELGSVPGQGVGVHRQSTALAGDPVAQACL